ncbi:TRM11 family SAM-dependent methyltransferase [Glycomyces albidus]|uniref:SAM-dependent methyltransferase n=1 Tax=Glycomyces albidus TaxID=2656774 RepID=A0A6L5GER0_9ACTN|nr:SAM-dependent methyltransferase [Glycomyces albidus]MQM28204.1 SAM-dependent methyltransferase [Glycomyces albidus]
MQQYAMLIAPSANRVYSQQATRMVANEIAVLALGALSGAVEDLDEAVFGGVPYLTFRSATLSGRDLRLLSNVSSLFALFEVHGTMLEPVPVQRMDRYDDDLVSILKYVGKTNEQFTKLLLNVTAASAFDAERILAGGLKVLDPMCGRGTTLNQAAMYGFDGYGVEVDKRDFEAYGAFIQRWLKDKRLKHKALTSRVKRDGRGVGQRTRVEFSATKELHRAGETQVLEIVNADTLRSGEVYKKRSFDLIVTDAPYGVQHAAVRDSRSLSRRPTELLEAAIPVWAELLRPGGAMGVSWNTYTTERSAIAGMLEAAGLAVMDAGPYLDFEHRVDHAINRDLIVARLPKER